MIRIKIIAGTLLLGSLSLGLTACGGSKDVVTYDNSADYKSAVSLPPLKKTSQNAASATPVNTPAPQAPTVVAATQTNSVGASNAEPDTVISAQVVEKGADRVRLLIDAPADAAWDYVNRNLRASDITVHQRNRDANNFEISCPIIEDNAAEVEKRGRWTFFKRKPEAREHCVLELDSGRSNTTFRVLDRTGVEMDAASARSLFARLLNN